jgi:hypothetical protein
MQNTGPYQNSPILNELHTHFPAFLYNEHQFQSVPDIFAYIRQQMHNRFDVYSAQRAQHNRQPRQRQRQRQRQPVYATMPTVPVYQPTATDAYSQFNRILVAAMAMPTVDFMDPVPVAPSTAQIEAGSTLHTAISDAPCAVCQDTIRIGEVTRRLNHCNHAFHRGCIDTWYQRNVHCPVCRHDIRS